MDEKASVKRGRVMAAVLVAALAAVFGCARPPVADVYPQVAEYDGRRIDELSFLNPEPFSADSLEELTETRETRCALLGFLPFCFPGTDWGLRVGRVNMQTVGEDLARLEQLYRVSGYFGTLVVPDMEEVGEDGGPIRFGFRVQRGDGVLLESLEISGTEGIVDPDSLRGVVALQPGELFELTDLVASADTVLEALRARGHAYAEVLRNYGVDTIQDRATVQILAVPGPRVEVDSILVDGLDKLSRPEVLRQLSFDQGAVLRLRDLGSSQRNLYDIEVVQFASVAVAADSLQLAPDDRTRATVRVAVGEGDEHVVETAVGYGTVECFGLRGRWTDRAVMGGSRRLTLTGEVSRIGLGDPLGGLRNTVLCEQGEDATIATSLDYRLAADFSQSYFLSPRNQLAARVFSERQSEPELFQRTATGGRLHITHRIRRREVLTAGLAVEYRTTDATPELYCFEFRACGRDEIERFLGGRWQNGFTATWFRDRSNASVNPTGGYTLRSSGAWSTPILGSDFDFLRVSLETAVYRAVGDWTLAGFARFGSFITRASLGPDNFVPPEERFFAGGANSVRGYDRFALGPGLYLLQADTEDPATVDPSETLPVQFFPTGGTSVGVLSVEARFPSPVLRDLLRLAVFVDAGTVGLEPIWKLESSWRVTPGAGLRISTPVGPARIDIGYNPYPEPEARLYAAEPGTGGGLVRIADTFAPADPGAFDLDRFRLHIAVGQAF